GTVFGLSSNAKMALTDMVYDPNGSSNSSFLSLLQGTITFVAGETAKHGDMKVDTPVATMGIRGTAVLAELGFEVNVPGAEPTQLRVLFEPGKVAGSFLYKVKANGQEYVVDKPGLVHYISGGGSVTSGLAPPLTDAVKQRIDKQLGAYFANYVPGINDGGPNETHPNSGSPPIDNPLN